MKIIDGLKLEGKPVRIPDCDRGQLPQFFVDMGFKVGVEIGVEKARFTRSLCGAGLKIHGVDPWLYYSDYQHSKGQERLDFMYEHSKRATSEFGDNCDLIRKTSMEAVKDFEDESIDFVYIDGHHGFKFVTEDIFEWSKKVKKGGIISGHDYAFTRTPADEAWVCHVKYVVNAYTEAFRIKNWYLLGSDEKIEGEKRETFRSWMWVKE